jgi:ABC-type transporter Mla MlaB component
MNNAPRTKSGGLIYYMHDESAAFRFKLAGDLSQDSTQDLEQARQTASSVFGGRCVIVDITGITSVDTAGREMLDKWHQLGARIVVSSAEAKPRIQSITDLPITVVGATREGSKWWPSLAMTLWLAALLVLLLLVSAGAGISASARIPATGPRFTLWVAVECGSVFN